jgi:hypothetical protein
LQKKNEHKLTLEEVRGVTNSRHEGNIVRGTVIRTSTVVTYLVSMSTSSHWRRSEVSPTADMKEISLRIGLEIPNVHA